MSELTYHRADLYDRTAASRVVTSTAMTTALCTDRGLTMIHADGDDGYSNTPICATPTPVVLGGNDVATALKTQYSPAKSPEPASTDARGSID
jgi:hypothetical protein